MPDWDGLGGFLNEYVNNDEELDGVVTARRNSNEIAAKIQQIKDQMAQLNTRDRDRSKRNDEWKRRNNGNGILGSYPTNNVNGRVDTRLQGSTSNDETQLSSAARAIVNSIRNMQVKTNNSYLYREGCLEEIACSDKTAFAHIIVINVLFVPMSFCM
ncbi:hypothetical protein evm_005143 [Chilo suppressalis]|nr:hypothetical protein evm_005143 [Chilo suppressalis]